MVMSCPTTVRQCTTACVKKENLGVLRCILVFVVLVQIVGAVAVVFYISYSSATAAGERIFRQLMTGVIERSRVEVDEFFKHPLILARTAQASARMMLPQMENWNSSNGFDPSTTPLIVSSLNYFLTQAQSNVVSVGLASAYGAAFATRDPGAPPSLIYLDGKASGNITYVKLNNTATYTWDYVREDLPLNSTLAGVLQSGQAYVDSVLSFSLPLREWFNRVSVALLCEDISSVTVISALMCDACLRDHRAWRCRAV